MPIPVGITTDDAGLYVGAAFVDIGGLRITNGMVVDGVTWDVEPVDGWDEPPTVTDWVTQRVADHGGWGAQSYWEPRVLELKGTLTGRVWRSLAQQLAVLRSAIPSFDPVDLTVAAAGAPALTCSVRQSGQPVIDQDGAVWTFSFSLTAVDPRKYAQDVTSLSTGLPVTTGGLTLPLVLPLSIGATTTSGRISVTNAGDMPTRPVFTITGPCPPCSITHSSGRRLIVPTAVDAGRSLTIDTDTRTALLDGTASRVVTGTWFEFDPGVNEVQFSSATYDAAALLTVNFKSAWR